jgi:hypothetical protein
VGLRPLLALHIHISPSNSSGQRNCASWASQPQKSVTLRSVASVVWWLACWPLVQTRPKPSDFSGKQILSMPSFGGEVKPSVPCRRFAACKKKTYNFRGCRDCRLNLIGHFSPIIPSFTDRGLSRRLMWSASGDGGGN